MLLTPARGGGRESNGMMVELVPQVHLQKRGGAEKVDAIAVWRRVRMRMRRKGRMGVLRRLRVRRGGGMLVVTVS